MMEEFLPRQHKRSFVFLLKISSSWRCCQFFSPPLFLGTHGIHDSSSVLWVNKAAGKILLIYFLFLFVFLPWHLSLKFKASSLSTFVPFCSQLIPRLLPIQLLHPTLKFLGGFCPIACLVHWFPSKIDILFLLGKNPQVGISVQDNNSISKRNINTSSNDDNKGTSQEIGCFGWIFPLICSLRWSLNRQCHILPVQNSPLTDPVPRCLGADRNMGMDNKQRWHSEAK